MKTLVVSTLLTGNGYAYIERDGKGNAVGLHFVPSELVTIISPRTISDRVNYDVTGLGRVEGCNMIHILNFSYDGITGISTLQHARNTLGASTDAESHAAGFFKGGANLAGLLKVNSSMTSKQK
jgi:HK97 family phage portal protein